MHNCRIQQVFSLVVVDDGKIVEHNNAATIQNEKLVPAQKSHLTGCVFVWLFGCLLFLNMFFVLFFHLSQKIDSSDAKR